LNSILLEPFESKYLGSMKNRVVMSPMSRGLADKNHCCTIQEEEYFIERARNGVALLFAGGMMVHPTGDGYNNSLHMWNKEHSDSWKRTVEKVHTTGSKIFCQLWHCGRISHEDYTGGIQPVSSTSKPAEGINPQNNKPFGMPRSLKANEIEEIYNLFMNSAEKAIEAGFDGIMLHMGHGYLFDQFINSTINDRNDQFGGSIENQCHFPIEMVKRMVIQFGPKKVIIRISPSREMNGRLYEWPDLKRTLDYFIPQLDKAGLRMIDVSCAKSNYYNTSRKIVAYIRPQWKHIILGGASLSYDGAVKEINDGLLDMVTWGRYILADPYFVSKLKEERSNKNKTV